MAHSFEDKDLELLEKSMKLRERMMDNIARRKDEELPSKPSDLMAVTNLLESVDRSIYAKAKINIEDSAAKNEEATKEVLRQLVTQLHNNKPQSEQTAFQNPSIPSFKSSGGFALTDGELITGSDNHVVEG